MKTHLTRKATVMALEAIRRRNPRGKLLPREVWKAARRDTNHPLHKKFNWNVQEAAELHWDATARQIIAAVYVASDGPIEVVPMYCSLSVDRRRGKDHGYHTVDNVLRDKELYQFLLQTAVEELTAFRERYNRIRELRPLWVPIKRVMKRRKVAVK